jgi:hypothetical protein
MEAYNIQLQYPRMFGIICGSKERVVVYPAELCLVEAGQFYRKKIPAELTPKVVEFATKSPEQRLHTINSGIGLGQGALQAPVSSKPFSSEELRIQLSCRLLNIKLRLSFRMLE